MSVLMQLLYLRSKARVTLSTVFSVSFELRPLQLIFEISRTLLPVG